MFSMFPFFAILLEIALGNPFFQNMAVHDQRGTPDGFIRQGPAAGDHAIKLRIALHQTNITGLQDVLMAVSTPGNVMYGQHLSKEGVEAFVSPTSDTVSIVNQWLSSNEISTEIVSPAGDWIQFSIPVKKANFLIRADYQVFKHTETGKELVRTLSYSIPATLLSHIDAVHPTTTFDNPFVHLPLISVPKLRVQRHGKNEDVEGLAPSLACLTAVTPTCLQALYKIPTIPATQSSNVLGVSGYIEQFANKADLATFLKLNRPDMSETTTFTLETLDGGSNSQAAESAGIEANLDIQYTVVWRGIRGSIIPDKYFTIL